MVIYLIKCFLDGNKKEVIDKYQLNKTITYELNKIWKDEEIKIINDILLQCSDNNDNENYINAIKNIINTKHDEIENLNCNI